MNKLYLFFGISFILVYSLSFVSSNFVCGLVNNSEDFSSSWSNALVYYEENPSDFMTCKINPENKFCCDLEEISSVKFVVGKKVFAEVFDLEGGFVGGPVSLFLTEEGYDIFPQMNLEEAIIINSPTKKIFVNESSILINLSLAENYNNLKYTLNSSQGIFEVNVCEECNNPTFSIDLDKGKNEIKFIAYNDNKEISETLVIYNLDYFNINLNVTCQKCKLKGDTFQVPSGENITFASSFNASHNISGDFLFYFPSEWILLNSLNYENISITHSFLGEQISNQKEFLINYNLQSPTTILKKEYTFSQTFEDMEFLTNVLVFKFKIIPFHKTKPFEKRYFYNFLMQRGSPDNPIIINSEESSLKTLAIFPNKEIFKSYSDVNFIYKKVTKRNPQKQYSFTIWTNIPKKDIEKILLIFKVEKGKSIEVYNNHKINLEISEENANFTYYSAYVSEKGPFNVKIY